MDVHSKTHHDVELSCGEISRGKLDNSIIISCVLTALLFAISLERMYVSASALETLEVITGSFIP